MPVFEFRCLQCGSLFEKLFRNSDGGVEITCPKCRSEAFERVISSTNYVVGSGKPQKPKITTKSCGSGNTCSTLEIPGPTR